MDIDEYTLECLDNLIQKYVINHRVLIEHDKEITVENRKMRTTVLTGLFSSGMTVYTNTIDCWIKENPKDKLQTEFRRKYINVLIARMVMYATVHRLNHTTITCKAKSTKAKIDYFGFWRRRANVFYNALFRACFFQKVFRHV